jgi:putative methyltransferase (TIGR04325 family)
MFIKKVVKEVTPPIFIRVINKLKGRNNNDDQNNKKEYGNYDLAIEDCMKHAYENEELCEVIASKTTYYIQTLSSKPFNLNSSANFAISAIQQYLLDNNTEKTVSVLDFGGACGAHCYEIRRFIPSDIKVKWVVIETAQMVETAKAFNFETEDISFVASISEVTDKIDIIHCSGSLQYVPKPHDYLAELLNLNAKMLFFNRMMFNENDRDLITIQESYLSANGPGKMSEKYTDKLMSFPHTTVSFKKFNDAIIQKGYENNWVFDESSGTYKINNETIIGKGLLYTKNK